MFLSGLPVTKIISLALLIAISGCATGVKIIKPYDDSIALKPEEGIIVAKVVNAASWPYALNQITLVPKGLYESKENQQSRLVAVGNEMKGSTFFIGKAKAGSFSLSSLRSYFSFGNYYYDHWVPTTNSLGTFEVRPGEITDLGTLIYYPKSDGEQYLKWVVRSPVNDNSQLISAYAPNKINNNTVIQSWNEDDFSQERTEQYAYAAQNPVVYNAEYISEDGHQFFIGKLGAIIELSPEGDWTMDALDTDVEMFAMSKNAKGDRVIGGENGYVFYRPTGGQWQKFTTNFQYQVKALSLADDGLLDVIVSNGEWLHVYRYPVGGAFKESSMVARFNKRLGWFDYNGDLLDSGKSATNNISIRHIGNVSLTQRGSKHFISIQLNLPNDRDSTHSLNADIFEYDPKSWNVFYNKSFAEMDFLISSAGELIAMKFPGFFAGNKDPIFHRYEESDNSWVKVSDQFFVCENPTMVRAPRCIQDSGVRYEPVDTMMFASHPVFVSPKKGYVVAITEPRNRKKSQKKYYLYTSDDGGKSWLKDRLELPNPFCVTLTATHDLHLLLTCQGSSSDVYQLNDNGVDWEHVREHGDF